jgi:hypothetical protein
MVWSSRDGTNSGFVSGGKFPEGRDKSFYLSRKGAVIQQLESPIRSADEG